MSNDENVTRTKEIEIFQTLHWHEINCSYRLFLLIYVFQFNFMVNIVQLHCL